MERIKRYEGVAHGGDVTYLWQHRVRGRYPDHWVASKLRHVIACGKSMWAWAEGEY